MSSTARSTRHTSRNDGLNGQDLDRAHAFIEGAEWIFARTVPEHPHWYAVRRDCARAGLGTEFLWFQALIEEAGYDRWWGWRTWRTIDIDDGFFYWLDGKVNLINRAYHPLR
jgi:hypothetical protein